MRNLEKYKGVIPAFYACYDKEGNISPEGVQGLTKYFVKKGVKGVYVNGSSGECIYQSVEDRKIVLENVMKVAEGKLTVIAHVACNNPSIFTYRNMLLHSIGMPLVQRHRTQTL